MPRSLKKGPFVDDHLLKKVDAQNEKNTKQVIKVIASAAANAQNNEGLDPSTLVVATVYADEGPTAKRIRPRAQGRAFRIRKRTSHITVIVESRPSKEERGGRSASAARARR